VAKTVGVRGGWGHGFKNGLAIKPLGITFAAL